MGNVTVEEMEIEGNNSEMGPAQKKRRMSTTTSDTNNDDDADLYWRVSDPATGVVITDTEEFYDKLFSKVVGAAR